MPSRSEAADEIAWGRAALTRGAWPVASTHFQRAVDLEDVPAAHEGLGIAARYLGELQAAVAAHEQGYRIARARRDDESASRLAAQLGIDAYVLGRTAEANGWVERALRLTDGREPSEGRALAVALRAHVAMLIDNDPVACALHASEAAQLARDAGSRDVEAFALALEGLALVASGAVADGMRRLDSSTAAAVAGEVGDVDMAETICCYLIDACKRVRDLDRAAEWCQRVSEIATRFDDRFMFAVCRLHHADVLLWQGAWSAADDELERAAAFYRSARSGRVTDALVRVAELRRRQGRLDDASELLSGCESHRLHDLHAGLLAFDRQDAVSALAAGLRFLRRVGDIDRFERVPGLELVVRAALALGRLELAEEATTELHDAAEAVGTPPFRASALLAQARTAGAREDKVSACALFEDAAIMFESARAPFEAAQAWRELAETEREAGRDRQAHEAEGRASKLLAQLGSTVSGTAARSGRLSPREQEVLRLVARGDSNDDIARALFLSVRTVERHVANVYTKLGLSGRTARAAATAWAHTHGVA
ncbi:MAG: LuxR C-terminal-related transcriptional regulator [Gaiella sp.]